MQVSPHPPIGWGLAPIVLGGHSQAFRVVQLDDRVFRFSVSSKSVGFHIFKLRSFECSDFKVFFHLWHGSGPNYEAELRNWEAEQADEWSDVVKRDHPPQHQSTPLTGANAIHVHGHHRLPHAPSSMEFSNFKSCINPGRRSVFTRINFGNQDSSSHNSTVQRHSISKTTTQHFLSAAY